MFPAPTSSSFTSSAPARRPVTLVRSPCAMAPGDVASALDRPRDRDAAFSSVVGMMTTATTSARRRRTARSALGHRVGRELGPAAPRPSCIGQADLVDAATGRPVFDLEIMPPRAPGILSAMRRCLAAVDLVEHPRVRLRSRHRGGQPGRCVSRAAGLLGGRRACASWISFTMSRRRILICAPPPSSHGGELRGWARGRSMISVRARRSAALLPGGCALRSAGSADCCACDGGCGARPGWVAAAPGVTPHHGARSLAGRPRRGWRRRSRRQHCSCARRNPGAIRDSGPRSPSPWRPAAPASHVQDQATRPSPRMVAPETSSTLR